MFGKKTENNLRNQISRSFIAETMQVEGELHSPGVVDVAGLINGNVYVGEMIIFDTGSVRGSLHVNNVEINGHLEGKIFANTVTLGSNAIIKGDISFKTSLKTEEGAEIDGYISKTKKGVRDKEIADIEKIEEKPGLKKPTLVSSNN